ncbi:MAG TPA: lysylphosphatidylglycerol synthase transmembrane domain-containing protein [Anaerolineae bacterium]
MRKLYFWIGLVISAVALWLAFREVHWDQLGDVLRSADYLWLLPSAIALLAAMAVRGERWRWLLGGRGRVAWAPAFRALSIGYLVTNIFPFRLGEVIRPVVLARSSKVSAMQGLSTIAVEHVLDVLLLLALLAVILPGLPLPAELALGAQRSAVLFGVAAVAMLMVVWQRTRIERVVAWTLRRIPRLHLESWLRRFNAIMDGLNMLRSPRLAAATLAWTVLAWLLSAVSFHLALMSFAPDAPFTASLFVTVATTIALLAPSSPGAIGVLQFAIQRSLLVFAVSETVGLAYAIVFHLMEMVVMNATGLISLAQEDLSWSSIVAQVRRVESKPPAPATVEEA